jgi:hypothetical protein
MQFGNFPLSPVFYSCKPSQHLSSEDKRGCRKRGRGAQGDRRRGDLGFVSVLASPASPAVCKYPVEMHSLPAHGCLTTGESSFRCDSLSPLSLSPVPFQTSLQLTGEDPLVPRPPPPSLGPGRKQEALSVLIALLDRRCSCSAV